MKFEYLSVDSLPRLKIQKRELFELLPGYSCNANCQFCSIDHAKRKINSNTNELIKSICQAKKEGFKYLGIGGGEPTIRKDLITLISLGKKLKFETVRIETNAIALSYFDYCRRLVEAGLDFVKISIHGHKPKIHDFLTQVPSSFNKVLKAIENLQKLKVRIEINTVINKLNYKFYSQFINFFAQRGIGSFVFIYPLYTGQMAVNWSRLGISIKELVPFLRNALQLFDALELDKALVFNIPPCFLKGYERKIIEEFNMKLIGPDLFIEDANSDIKTMKLKLNVCKNCRYNLKCSGVRREYIEIFGEKEFLR